MFLQDKGASLIGKFTSKNLVESSLRYIFYQLPQDICSKNWVDFSNIRRNKVDV